jgi:hypothetical protein
VETLDHQKRRGKKKGKKEKRMRDAFSFINMTNIPRWIKKRQQSSQDTIGILKDINFRVGCIFVITLIMLCSSKSLAALALVSGCYAVAQSNWKSQEAPSGLETLTLGIIGGSLFLSYPHSWHLYYPSRN